jgi:hypothetical protein
MRSSRPPDWMLRWNTWVKPSRNGHTPQRFFLTIKRSKCVPNFFTHIRRRTTKRL